MTGCGRHLLRLLAGVVGLGLTALPVRAAPKSAAPRHGLAPAPGVDLLGAVRRGDRAEISRLADRLGPGGLAAAMAGNDAGARAAAVEAAPLSTFAPLLVAPLTALASAGDPSLAGGAVRALGDILDRTDPTALDEWDVPPDVLSAACDAIRTLAGRSEAAVPLRLVALEAAAAAASVCTASGLLAPLLHDPSPAVRRAAVLAVRADEQAAAAGLVGLLVDPDQEVAAAAAAALCRSRRAPPAALAASRRLLASAATPIDDAVDLLACLAQSGAAGDARLLGELGRGAPGPIRDRAAALSSTGR